MQMDNAPVVIDIQCFASLHYNVFRVFIIKITPELNLTFKMTLFDCDGVLIAHHVWTFMIS